jgi:hypothetical protein
LKLPSDPNKYTAQFKWVEVGRYVPKLDKLIREKIAGDPVFIEVDKLDAYMQKNGQTGIYTSVWQYNTNSLNSIKLGPLYFDLDSEDADLSRQECLRLVQYLNRYIPREGIRTFFTGSKGFHVECEPVCLGINPGNHLSALFRYIATDLKDKLSLTTLDFAVYDERRMWRLPNTKHQFTGLYKIHLNDDQLRETIDEIRGLATSRIDLDVPEQTFNAKANEWYRNYTYAQTEAEKPQHTPQELLARFLKYGSRTITPNTDADREFDAHQLFEGCHAILDWWKYSEEKHDLPHEARLFLCSILTYSDEAERYLHAILQNCSDYSYEKSQSHIDDWKKRRELGIGGRPYSCARANAVGVGCGNCDLEPKKKWIEVNGKLVESDEESAPSPIRFCYKRKNKHGN